MENYTYVLNFLFFRQNEINALELSQTIQNLEAKLAELATQDTDFNEQAMTDKIKALKTQIKALEDSKKKIDSEIEKCSIKIDSMNRRVSELFLNDLETGDRILISVEILEEIVILLFFSNISQSCQYCVH